MSVITVRELNSQVSLIVARAAAGEVIDISRDGKIVAELRPKRASKLDDPEFREKWERMVAGMKQGVPGLVGPVTYEERTER